MSLHGVDVGAVEQRLVGVWVIAPYPLDQVVLPHHLRLPGRFLDDRGGWGNGRRARRPDRGLLLHARKVGARARHICCPLAAPPPQDITPFHHSRKALTNWLTKSDGPAFGRAETWN